MRSLITIILLILFVLIAGSLSVTGQQDGRGRQRDARQQNEARQQTETRQQNETRQKGEAGKQGVTGQSGREDPRERAKPRARPPMEFEPRVTIGDPVEEDCTVRCHINFPFDTNKRFSHLTHGPRRGFRCKRCHSDDPLPLETHGKLTLVPGGCGKCHHNPSRFDSCDTCHKPVYFQMEYKGIPFNHYKHAYAENAIACSLCHSDLLTPKNQREPFSCFTCHHVEKPPLDCRVCHQDAFELKQSKRFEGFRHKIHAETRHITKRCWTCHDKDTMKPPETMDCQGCHHPKQMSPNRDCRICHKRIENRRLERINPKFLHEPHISEGFPCTRCHGLNLLRSAEMGLDCQGCHHEHKGGCRKCHDHKIYFIRWYDNIPASPELPFLHAVHETDDNCDLCHLSGRSIRKGFDAMNCADCHHYSGHSPGCDFCHPEIERTRSGLLPSGRMGSPDVMHGIVSCENCHGYDPSSYRGLADGFQSCTLCHPKEYMVQHEEMKRVLNDAMNRFRIRSADPSDAMSLRQALHNSEMSLEYFRTAQPKGVDPGDGSGPVDGETVADLPNGSAGDDGSGDDDSDDTESGDTDSGDDDSGDDDSTDTETPE